MAPKKQEDAPVVAGMLTGPGDTPGPASPAPDATPATRPDATATDILRALLRESRAFQIEQREQHKVVCAELERIRRALAELGIQHNPAMTPGEAAVQDAPAHASGAAPRHAANGNGVNGAKFDRDAASAAYENCLKAFSVPFDPATGKIDWTRISMTQADLYRLMSASDAPTTGQYQLQGNGKEIGERLGDARRLWVARASARGDAAEAKLAVMRWLAEPVPDSAPRISRYQALTSGLVGMGDLYPMENLQKVRALVPADPSVTVADAAARAAANPALAHREVQS